MRIAQITWIAYNNFGTSLQAYALQKVLQSMGHQVTLIDDLRLTHLTVYYQGLLHLPRRLKNRSAWARQCRYRRFANKYLSIDRRWKDAADLSARYDAFVCGSDQIWSPLLPNHHGGFYFAAPMSGLKIAYAPSLGAKTAPPEYCSMVKPWLNDFKALSAREVTGAKILADISGREVPTVLDPTLLLPAAQWCSAFPINNNGGAYLLAYFLTYNEVYLRRARELADSMGVELVIFAIDKRMRQYADRFVDVGPEEFLRLIAGSRGVMTDSFHGTIFAIHMRRPLLTVQRFRPSEANNQNSRIENLFSLLEIADSFRSEDSLKAEPARLQTLDWERCEELLESARKTSMEYLKNALTC